MLPKKGRFALLRHDLPKAESRPGHWDLLLESVNKLLTFEILMLPCEPGPLNWRRLPDHRMIYLEYEGEVSEQRGVVKRLAGGVFEAHVSSRRWAVALTSPHLNARMTIKLDGGELSPVGTQIEFDVQSFMIAAPEDLGTRNVK